MKDDRSVSPSEHTHLLPWYVAGTTDPVQTRQVEAHLDACADCRSEVEALASMMKTLMRSRSADHVPAPEMVLYESGRLAGEPLRLASIEGHLEACAGCREDLRILGRVRQEPDAAQPPETSAPRPVPGPRRAWSRPRWILAAAAGVAIVCATLWILQGRPQGEVVTFLPAHRGAGSANVLAGQGPWRIAVVLPPDAPDGTYRARIVREDGPRAPEGGGAAWNALDGRLTLEIPRLREPGAYRLVLDPPGAGRPSYEYPFEVAGPPTSGARRRASPAAREEPWTGDLSGRRGASDLPGDLDALLRQLRFADAEAVARRNLRAAEAVRGAASIEAADALEHLVAVIYRGKRPALYEEGVQLAERSLAIRSALLGPEHPRVGKPLMQLGNVLQDRGDYAGARRNYELALEVRLRSAAAKPSEIVASLIVLAEMLKSIGDLDEAGRLYRRALEILEGLPQADPVQAARCLGGRADLLALAGDFEAAQRLFEQALALRRIAFGDGSPMVGKSLYDLSVLHSLKGDHQRASELSGRALANHERAWGRDHPWLVKALNNHAEHLYRTGEYENAKALYERSMRILERENESRRPLAAATRDGLARTLWALGDADGALANALAGERRAREQFRQVAGGLTEREAYLYQRRRPTTLDTALSILASGSGDGAPGDAAARVWDELVRSRAMILDEMAARHRGRIQGGDARGDLLVQDLQRRRHRLARLIALQLSAESPEDLGEMLGEAEAEKERAERELARFSPRFRLDLAASGAGLRDVAESLPEGGALLGFVRYDRVPRIPGPPAEPSYLALVLRSGEEGAIPFDLGSAGDIDALAQAWRVAAAEDPRLSGAGRSGERRYRDAGARLRRAVWDPVEPALRQARLILIVPDGSLHLVNFATLPAGDDAYLVETAPLLHHLSAERDLVRAREPRRAGEGLLALGGPDFDAPPVARADGAWLQAAGPSEPEPPGAGPGPRSRRGGGAACAGLRGARFAGLPGARTEVEEIASLWAGGARGRPPGGEVLTLTGPDADEAAFKRLAPGRRVLHLATHGFFLQDTCPAGPQERGPEGDALLLSGLALAGANRRDVSREEDGEDGILTAEEIASLDLHAVEWAVLSACETGVANVLQGEGVLGLRRALEVAGARTLIMSLWAVEDAATRAWMRGLYEGRLMGLSTARAVRKASLDAIERQRRRGATTHPFLWGGFVATGDWR